MSEQKPPLWEVIKTCDIFMPVRGLFPRRLIAVLIRAIRDWLVPEEDEVFPDGRSYAELAYRLNERQRLRALLTAEADRAGNGDQPTNQEL